MNEHATQVVLPGNSNVSRPCTMPSVNTSHRPCKRLIASRVCLFFCAMLLSACGPSEQQKAAAAEQKRIECLEKFCEGDVEPERDHMKDELLKFNGQWYLGPKYYYSSGINGASFSWPSKKSREDIPQVERDSNSDIVLFLSGRARWSDEVRNNPEPWKRKNGESPFEEEMRKEGYRAEIRLLHSDLEHAKYFNANGRINMHEVFTAINEREPLGGGKPSIYCRSKNSSNTIDELSSCTGGFFWTENIAVSIRMSGKHVNDWPEIYKEIIRILQLLKKA